ncbi:MAG: flagellar hook-length control protein FliK [Eubacterium sp.]|nr:flagellar hook-length control protein FliK [Eubacterium sp.]
MTVNNVNALLNYKAAQTQVTGQIDQTEAKQQEIAQAGFGKIMSKVNDTIKELHAQAAGNTVATVSSNTAAAANAVETANTSTNANAGTNTVKKETPVQESEKPVTDDSDKAQNTMQQDGDKSVQDTDAAAETDGKMEEVEKTAEELVQDIADEMDVTPEEVEDAMAVLGLTAVQLFDVDNLKQVLLQISGSSDELSLVTNETLYGNLQNLLTAVEESFTGLQEELGISGEELNALVEQMVSEVDEPVAENQPNVQDVLDVPDEGLAQDMPEVNLEGMKDYTVSVQKDGATVQVKVTVDDASGNKSIQEEVTDTPKVEAQSDRKMQMRDASADQGRGERNASDHAAGNPLLQTPDRPTEVIETPAPVNAGYQSMQTEEIMNQIMDYMKINLKADTQQMELQLHPASLGTVNVQIAAKDGAITAQFTTQNETVRAVIETQLIQLKQQFEEQGIKVDAVEVTVANHEYGQQFSQDNANTDQKQGKSAKGTRRINLNELEEDSEMIEMEESERIAVEMMQANGSTVDYTA